MKKLLFISSYDSSFVKSDIEILGKYFRLSVPNLLQSRRNVGDYLRLVFVIFWGVFSSDLVFCWFADFSAYLAVMAANLFRKKVYVVVGGYEVAALPGYGGLNRSDRRARLKYILTKATRVIAISDFSLNEIEALKYNVKTEMIAIGIEPAKESFPKADLIVTSGSATQELFRVKGLDVFARATAGFPGFRKVLIGEYDHETKKQLLAVNPALEFFGKLPHHEFLEELKKARVYCQFSQRESFGLAVLEAMNYGCIPVVARVGAMPEIVGEVGFICTYGDAKEAEKAIASALQSIDEMAVRKRAAVSFSRQEREEKLIRLIGRDE